MKYLPSTVLGRTVNTQGRNKEKVVETGKPWSRVVRKDVDEKTVRDGQNEAGECSWTVRKGTEDHRGENIRQSFWEKENRQPPQDQRKSSELS